MFNFQHKTKVTVIFCGDFNSVPSSGVFAFMTRGILGADHPDCTKCKYCFSTYVVSCILIFASVSETQIMNMQHQFQFISACGTPQFTNYTLDFKSCLDYIFCERSHVSVTGIAAFPSEDVLSANVALPSEVFPSDHIASVADLQWL